jgi:hypothetical protein
MKQGKQSIMTTKPDKLPALKTVAVAKFPEPPDKEVADALATLALRPSANAATVVVDYTKTFGEQDIGALADALSASMDVTSAGDMNRVEGMLFGQAHALQAIFINLARRAVSQEQLKAWEATLRMAMKAQNQCRMTLETLATIKNPPVVFARQANINNGGQQQVNNGRPPAGAPAGNSSTEQTELLETSDGQWLDTGAAGKAGGVDPHMEAVGKVHRPQQR